MKTFEFNSEAQAGFVTGYEDASAYIGGLGSGKTWAGIARGLAFSDQPIPPGALYGPRGLCGAATYRALQDVVLPQFWEMTHGTGLVAEWRASEMKAILHNGAEILFRSLDNVHNLRGMELSWYFIDEGRNLSKEIWEVLSGRLRQKGFRHAGWVASTPNGFDWMWQLFHSDSKKALEGSRWYGASTLANKEHVGAEYIKRLETTYVKGSPLYMQEVEGKFIGALKGAVYPEFNIVKHLTPITPRPNSGLYTGWDFGIGDEGVCVWAHIDWHEMEGMFVPSVDVLDVIRSADWNADEWADAYHETRQMRFEGREPNGNWGDPAGMQRTGVTGTSMIDALRSRGVKVNPAQKQPVENGVQLLRPIMAADRFHVDEGHAEYVAQALTSAKWKVDDLGNRIGSEPVHDWTSHTSAAIRYLAVSEMNHWNRRVKKEPKKEYGPGTAGHIMEQTLKRKSGSWVGKSKRRKALTMPVRRIGG